MTRGATWEQQLFLELTSSFRRISAFQRQSLKLPTQRPLKLQGNRDCSQLDRLLLHLRSPRKQNPRSIDICNQVLTGKVWIHKIWHSRKKKVEKMPKEKMLRKCKQKWWNIPLNYTDNQVKPAFAPPGSFYWLPATKTSRQPWKSVVQLPAEAQQCLARSDHFLKNLIFWRIFQATCFHIIPPLQLKHLSGFPCSSSLCPLPLLAQGTPEKSLALFSTPHSAHQVFRHMDEIPSPSPQLPSFPQAEQCQLCQHLPCVTEAQSPSSPCDSSPHHSRCPSFACTSHRIP